MIKQQHKANGYFIHIKMKEGIIMNPNTELLSKIIYDKNDEWQRHTVTICLRNGGMWLEDWYINRDHREKTTITFITDDEQKEIYMSILRNE